MFKPLELFIGLRYTRAKRRNHFISFIALTSMLGIALGVMALITVLSEMNGFQKELRDRILGVVAHATVSGVGGGVVADWLPLADRIKQVPDVVGIAPYVNGEGMLSSGQAVSGALIRGVLPQAERTVSDVGDKMVAGSLDDLVPGQYGIILGKELALRLGVWRGDKETLLAPTETVPPSGILPRLERITIVGIFEIGMYEYDSALALLDLDDAAKLYRLDGVSGVRLKLDDMMRAPRIARDLERSLSADYDVSDWTRQHVNFFRAVQTEKTVKNKNHTLIIAVAAFNIVSTLVMMVRDKESDIAVLRTLGATPRSIMLIFMIQGVVIGVIGTLLGGIGGVVLALNDETIVQAIEHIFGVEFLSADVYYINELPSELHSEDVWRSCGSAVFLSLIATLYPAWRASRTQPAEALRYE